VDSLAPADLAALIDEVDAFVYDPIDWDEKVTD
jgi:hypothetical protein